MKNLNVHVHLKITYTTTTFIKSNLLSTGQRVPQIALQRIIATPVGSDGAVNRSLRSNFLVQSFHFRVGDTWRDLQVVAGFEGVFSKVFYIDVYVDIFTRTEDVLLLWSVNMILMSVVFDLLNVLIGNSDYVLCYGYVLSLRTSAF